MSKRPYEESLFQGGSPPESIDNSHNGLLPINDLLSPETPQSISGSVKKPRNFIATVSLSLIMSTLHRLETKLEHISSAVRDNMQPLHQQMLHALEGLRDAATPKQSSRASDKHPSLSNSQSQHLTPEMGQPDDFVFDERPNTTDSNGHVSISFSQHGVILWPGAREILPRKLLEAHERLGRNYVIDLEMKRPHLPMYIYPYPPQAGEDWLETLPLAMIKGLSDAFFATFNPFTPIMDKTFYFAFTLGAAIESGFGYTIETCLVLNVMALGCLAVLSHQEGNYPLPGTRSSRFEPPEWMGVIHEEPPGLRFFNEARRRIGFLMCDNDIQSCQFYLLSYVYYSQILRPMDSWAMIHRAATCCLSMLTNHDVNFDEWEGDMKSRVYWNTLMNETILVQELHLPPSGLSRLEELVPIPKFIGFESVDFVPARFSSSSDEIDESFFQYHFLAQVAHRIILTRIRRSLYFYSDSGTFPLPAVNAELRHQLEQWRINLPPALQFSDSQPSTPMDPNPSPAPVSPLPIDPNRPLSPAIAVTEAMLRGRYMIANFHIGRPYLYKALRIPQRVTDHDLEQMRNGLRHAMDWPPVGGIFRKMKSCIPIKFAFCSQFFGQVLLFYCISHHPDPRLRKTLPVGWERWTDEILRFLEDCAPFSPAVSKDLELLQLLR
ncbi:hypothetical protein KXW26_009208 [Aspergillus fumigatus]|nr:hypothetical protein KXV35_005233 [Aspergillus fumigatus]KAH2173833.1 hypothetical protein KXW37_000591 [Aspergillus fumigatus]KAH2271224.1 hypothetical protein KXW26_009208 [Aspergillus fumigatus]